MEIGAQLRELAGNLWWSWHPDTIALFRDIDTALWREANHNPIVFLDRIPPDQLKRRATELALEARVNFAFHRLHDHLQRSQNWGHIHCGKLRARPVAYFSAEFGLHESIPIYSGGLGILAGDHLKSASDLGIPLIGVGLFYAHGYFNQGLDEAGWQQETYNQTQVQDMPFQRVNGPDGEPLRIQLNTRSDKIGVGVWRMLVGRNSLYLLDSDIEGNSDWNRQLTGRLYGGDAEVRMRQELILGVGGMRTLHALGINPGVLHLNEGHSAFALLEMARQRMERDQIPFADGMRRVTRRTLFVTHTPVDAGHDRFPKPMIEEVLGPLRDQLGLSHDELMALGRVKPDDKNETFCMTVLGLKCARKARAVSSLHGHVSRRMWKALWPGRSEFEVPIEHVTNGVHVFSWLAPPMRKLFDSNLGANWDWPICRPETWARISDIKDSELWEVHQVLKTRLVDYVQRRVCRQEALRGGSQTVCDMTMERLDPDVLTIGFSRRFATYKRADLILSDEEQLEKLIRDPERPIQIIFAGKAHPNDDPGKKIIQRIFNLRHDPRFMGRVVFLEDYDINVARHLLQGVDVWMNLPLRPHEACGTSGMKALFNGVLNMSILDGWWAEAYDGANGFAIGAGGEHSDHGEQDRRDEAALHNVLVQQVIPLYYERDELGVPTDWVARMKHALQTLGWRFNASRMVMQYAMDCYLPLAGDGSSLHTEFVAHSGVR